MIDEAANILLKSRSITVLTGAGISAESGLPTYRDENGLWTQYRSEDFSSVQAFHEDPNKVWEWYRARRVAMAAAEPNDGHKTLAEMERRSPKFTLLTQNVDGLHQRAGNTNVIELHGSVWRLRCTGCSEEWPDENVYFTTKCPFCYSLARPAVVWFGEELNARTFSKAMEACECDTFLVVGTSAQVNPVAMLPTFAKESGARIIEVNTEPTGLSGTVNISLAGKAGEILPKLLKSHNPFDGEIREINLNDAIQRGFEKFFQRHPELRPKRDN